METRPSRYPNNQPRPKRMESFKVMTLSMMFFREELPFADDKALRLAFLIDRSLIMVTNIKITLVTRIMPTGTANANRLAQIFDKKHLPLSPYRSVPEMPVKTQTKTTILADDVVTATYFLNRLLFTW